MYLCIHPENHNVNNLECKSLQRFSLNLGLKQIQLKYNVHFMQNKWEKYVNIPIIQFKEVDIKKKHLKDWWFDIQGSLNGK